MVKTLIQILCFFTILINLFYNLKMLKKGIEINKKNIKEKSVNFKKISILLISTFFFSLFILSNLKETTLDNIVAFLIIITTNLLSCCKINYEIKSKKN